MPPFSLKKPCLAIKILILILISSPASAQIREEFEDRKPSKLEIEALERDVIEKKALAQKQKFLASLELSATYETNARQTAIRKGDTSENLKYSLFFKRLLGESYYVTLNYNFDGTLYGEYNELSNVLNHTRLAVDKALNQYLNLGVGYDFSSFYYPDSKESDFFFHKIFASLKHQSDPKIYQQFILEDGFKDYVHARAYADSVSTFQDSDRRDYRYGAEYILGMSVIEKLFLRIRTKYSINDSNALYQDYHDYTSVDIAPYLSYQFSEKYLMTLSLSATKRDYTSRKVSAMTSNRRDLIYIGNVGVRYLLDQNNNLNLGYGYTQGDSNDSAAEYSGSSVTCGWQHQF
jgi:hypothetical protein